MTWEEWIDSEYNVDGYKITYDNINSSTGVGVYYNGNKVKKSDLIYSDMQYILSGQHSGGV